MSAKKLTFAEAYAQEVAFVWRSLRRMGVPARNVEDACQETFVVAHRKYAEFEVVSEGSLRGWLFAIAMRVAADYRKRAHVRREVFAEEPIEVPNSERATAAVAETQARALLDGILDGLDEEKRAVFVLFELQQLPMNEVAAIVGCPVATAYSRLQAARERVAEAIARIQAAEGRR